MSGMRSQPTQRPSHLSTAGIVHKISLENFLCHDNLEMEFNQHINFIIGRNGSGKSAILTGIVVALGQKASSTSRGSSIKDFIKTGKTRAVVRVTLVNQGPCAYLRETYGDYITIERIINQSGSGGYKILNEHGRSISNKRSDLNRILAKMNLQVDNPVCILNQETAKNFLHNTDPKSKYQLFERATQMDVVVSGFTEAEEQLAHSKSCLKEKKESLDLLKAELKKWHDRNEWYEAIDEVNEKRSRLENMIAWAQIQDYEKKAAAAQVLVDDQKKNLDKLLEKKREFEKNLTDLQESHRQRNQEVANKVNEIKDEREVMAKYEEEQKNIKNQMNEIKQEMKQLDADMRRYNREKDQLLSAITEIRNSDQDSEFAARKAKRLQDLNELQQRESELVAKLKVSDGHLPHLKNAVVQFKNEAQNIRNEISKHTRELEPKKRTLAELNQSGGNRLTVFGEWVPKLLARIDQMPFHVKPIGPAGTFIKVRDKTWAPLVEKILGRLISTFICSSDHDAKLLGRLLDELNLRGGRPTIITSQITGQRYDVSENKVRLNPDDAGRDVHCLMDVMDIEDADVANMLVDMLSIETVLLIANDREARHMMSERSRVPPNCRVGHTKEGNIYHPDPNYRSYAGRVGLRARYLQVSVEDTIRVLEEEIEVLEQEVERTRANLDNTSRLITTNETELHTEETRLNKTKRDLLAVREQLRVLETQQEPEPIDVLTFEEDLADTEAKLSKTRSEMEEKKAKFEGFAEELTRSKEKHLAVGKRVQTMMNQVDPERDLLRQNEARQRDLEDRRVTYSNKEETMRGLLKEFEADFQAATKKAEEEAELARRICPRVTVNKSVKSLNAELKQIMEQLTNHEKEYGSREFVLNEFVRRKGDYDRAKEEVLNSTKSLHRMIQMAKKRKEFIIKFRESIMVRTHYVFQGLLRNRNFEGELRFDSDGKTLTLLVTPPGRAETGGEGPPQKRARSATGTDIRTLSGGERSYATVCFIISLWDAIESPFRVLDEFDVFMDEVNRRVSMDLLITEANENDKHQYIFLTPLGLELDPRQSNLAIFRMHDPNRAQAAQNT